MISKATVIAVIKDIAAVIEENWHFLTDLDAAIGDADHPVEPLDIVRVNRLMYATAFLALVLCCGVPLLVTLAL